MGKIGLVDVDGGKYPNLPLMKLSAWHKQNGDNVDWYYPLYGYHDIVYLSKVFSFSPDVDYPIYADITTRGGSGYATKIGMGGIEQYDASRDLSLPVEIEHIFPDYSLYNIQDTAYGFLSRGCPRGCEFCNIKDKDGLVAHKTADLDEFWNGQKNICLYDPNILACKEWKALLYQLVDSGAKVDFNQGLDIRLMTDEKAELIKKIRTKIIHLAFDKYEDGEIILPKLKAFQEITGYDRHAVYVYVLCNFDTTLEQDLERIYAIKEIGFAPYVMLYGKYSLPKGSIYYKLQRYVNNPWIFNSLNSFDEYNG